MGLRVTGGVDRRPAAKPQSRSLASSRSMTRPQRSVSFFRVSPNSESCWSCRSFTLAKGSIQLCMIANCSFIT